jgi:outer membrane immunogenic protein
MKRFCTGLATAAAVFGATNGTSVADMLPSASLPAHSWAGFYLGGNAGYGWSNNRVDGISTIVDGAAVNFPSARFGADGALAGGQVGYNWQSARWIVGVEADLQWTNIERDLRFPQSFFGIPSGDYHTDVSSELKYFGTARGRIGYAFDAAWRPMIYATAGVAYGRVESTLSFPYTSGAPLQYTASDSRNHVGWTLGAGLESRLTERLSAKLEYLYVDFGQENYKFRITGTADWNWREGLDFHVVRFGLNYHFTQADKLPSFAGR